MFYYVTLRFPRLANERKRKGGVLLRTLRFYSTITYYLLRHAKILNKVASRLHAEGNSKAAYKFIDKIAAKAMRKIIKISGADVSVKGIEHLNLEETYLFVGNHQGNYDIPLIYTYSPIKMAFAAKEDLEKIPLIGSLMKQRGCIFLKKDNPRDSVLSINRGIEVLKSGESLCIFPEGKRSKSSEMNLFKPGALRLAIKAGVKVVPVVIDGSYKLMEANNGKVKPASVEITFLPPIDSKKYKDSTQLCEVVEKTIRENLQK